MVEANPVGGDGIRRDVIYAKWRTDKAATPGYSSLGRDYLIQKNVDIVLALLIAVAIASVAKLKRKETANLKPDIDAIIAK